MPNSTGCEDTLYYMVHLGFIKFEKIPHYKIEKISYTSEGKYLQYTHLVGFDIQILYRNSSNHLKSQTTQRDKWSKDVKRYFTKECANDW